MAAVQLTRTHKTLIGVVVAGAVLVAGIGFVGSYTAVRELAVKKGFGTFSYVFPIGIDAGICVLLALDLLLTWIRIPFPLLRQTAWVLTAATIAFNGAAAWPDPLGVGMHAVIPVLFVVTVEAARHAVGRIADITADKHMEGVRLTRWLLSPVPTFLLWRRMKLWEIRSYEVVIKVEQHRLVYESQLHTRYGRRWRSKAPVEALMPLRLAKYGVPLTETAPHVLEEAGLDLSTSVTVERAAAVPVSKTGEHQRALEGGGSGAAGSREQEADPAALSGGVGDGPVSGTDALSTSATAQPAMADALGEVVREHSPSVKAYPFFVRPAPPSRGMEATPVEAEPGFSEQGPAPVSARVDEGREGGGVREEVLEQASLNLPLSRLAEPIGSEPSVWESAASDPREATATARVPQQQNDEPQLDRVQQQIVTVAEWIIEAEESRQKLSGAEVARRLNLSPRTGQRRLDKASEYVAEQRRQQGRAHLRSVGN
ncbi:DUF2637 domain-containing protein [Streptomyces sp. NPDC056470]|uniref:DUF2637 domain-containing protein n=1 Tax=Streptomyces sp. NPDC056470 TaxID=3345831 RepID=UPI0036B977FC